MREARLRAAEAANSELVLLYWHIGREILKRRVEQGWGAKVVHRLSRDLMMEFPGAKGFSPRNLQYMQEFAGKWPQEQIAQQLLRNLPWGHIMVLLERIGRADEREWYAAEAVKNGWSRSVLVHHIDTDLCGSRGKALTNFSRALPPERSDMAQALLKDPYPFEFLGLPADADERTLEAGLIERLEKFLLALGVGFAFVGRQVPLTIGGDEFYVDLLFYHLRLRCFVVVELKAGEFRPEHAGKLNFYLAAVDDMMRHPEDRPSIGMILCRSKNRVVVEYSLRAAEKPMGVATYALTKELPRAVHGALPGAEELERALRDPRRDPTR